jgi:hypothetical protein
VAAGGTSLISPPYESRMMPPEPSDDWRWRRSIQLAIVDIPRGDIGSRTYRDLAANGS